MRKVLHEDEQQQELQVRRRALPAPVRVIRVDDGAVIDGLAPVRRAEHLAVHGVPQQDQPAPRSDLFGRHRA